MPPTVSTIADLNAAILSADASLSPGTITINLGSDIALGSTVLEALTLAAGVTLDIIGNGHTLDGGGTQHGLFVYGGTVDISGLTIADMVTQGGNGQDSGNGAGAGGGGAGLGGGLFIGSGATVALTDTGFSNNQALGGAGGMGNAEGLTTYGAGGISSSGLNQFGNGGQGGKPGGFRGTGSPFGGGGGGGGSGQGGNSDIGGGDGANSGATGSGSSGGAGGGGLGAGGDIFVQAGGSLTINGSASVAAGTVTGGNAGTGAGVAGSGLGLGNGIYFQGSNTLTFTPTGLQTVSGSIADDIGSAVTFQFDPGYHAGLIGLLVNGTGTLDLTATNTFYNGTTLASGTLVLDANGAAGFGAITFTGAATLDITAAALNPSGGAFWFTNTINGFATGDSILLPGFTFDPAGTAIAQGGWLQVIENGNTVELEMPNLADGTQLSLAATSSGTQVLMCFCTGTRIATPNGEVAVETLQQGGLVRLADGRALPVRWLGRQTVSRRFAGPARTLPVRIHAGALGSNLPQRDLLLSPGHAVLLGGLLVQAGALVNGDTITRETAAPEVFQYWHIELDEHAILLAEGLPAESLLDRVDPMAFDNAAGRPEAAALAELPYPRVKSARQLPQALRQWLAGASRQTRSEAA